VEYQFILILNMNRFAPFSNDVNPGISESSEESLSGQQRTRAAPILVSY